MAGQYRSVDTGQSFPALEERILGWWKENSIFEQSMELRAGNPEWVFYEGPPTANGKPGIHHVLTRIFKDLYPRYKTMQGFYVGRKAGWDCHGLPVELEIEKRLGIEHKEQIEAYGVAAFNKLCKESVLAYVDDWNRMTERIGMWLDLDDPYITMTDSYIESVWWILSEFSKKGLLFEGYKVVPYCPRCGTALSSHEVASGYQMVTDPSVFVRFPLVSGDASAAGRRLGRRRRAGPVLAADGLPVSLLVWTTTPWTLISNVAAAVGPDISTRRPSSATSTSSWPPTWWRRCSATRPSSRRPTPAPRWWASTTRRVYQFVKPEKPAWRVIAADYVATDEGSGIVHIAPAFGADDMIVGQENDLPVVMPVDLEGRFTAEVTPWAGVFVKDADASIMDDLEARGLLVRRLPYEHNYPFCWRCDTPLIYYAKIVLVREDHRPQGRRARRQRGGHLVSRPPQARPLRQVAGEQHRLVALPRPLLGHAAPGLALRQRPRHRDRLPRGAGRTRRPRPLRSRTPPPLRGRSHLRLPGMRRRRHPRHLRHRRLVRFAAPCPSPSGTIRSRTGTCSKSASRPISSAKPSTRPAAGSTACWPSAPCSPGTPATRTCCAWATSSTATAARCPSGWATWWTPGASSTSKAPTPCAGTCSRSARPGSRAASARRAWTRSSASSSSRCGTPTRSTRCTRTSTASTPPPRGPRRRLHGARGRAHPHGPLDPGRPAHPHQEGGRGARRLRRLRRRPGHRRVRGRAVQLVRPPQPPPFLEERGRLRQDRRLPHPERVPDDGGQAAGAVHPVPGGGDVSKSGG